MRKALICLSHQFLLNYWCPLPIGWYVNQTEIRLGKKGWMYYCKAICNFFFNVLGFSLPFHFKLYFIIPRASKVNNDSKFAKKQEIFANLTLDGGHHQFDKNWWIRHKSVFLINTYVGPKNIGKNQNLFSHQSKITLPGVCYEIPCTISNFLLIKFLRKGIGAWKKYLLAQT